MIGQDQAIVGLSGVAGFALGFLTPYVGAALVVLALVWLAMTYLSGGHDFGSFGLGHLFNRPPDKAPRGWWMRRSAVFGAMAGCLVQWGQSVASSGGAG